LVLKHNKPVNRKQGKFIGGKNIVKIGLSQQGKGGEQGQYLPAGRAGAGGMLKPGIYAETREVSPGKSF